MATYRTVSGDTFDIIAKKTLGDEKLAGSIIEKNLDYVDVILFDAGVELTIPDQDVVGERMGANLPPWKRGDG